MYVIVKKTSKRFNAFVAGGRPAERRGAKTAQDVVMVVHVGQQIEGPQNAGRQNAGQQHAGQQNAAVREADAHAGLFILPDRVSF